MVGKAGLKAGLIGAAVLFVLALLSLVSALSPALGVLGCVCCGLEFLIYAGAGALGGFFLTVPRTAGKGAGAGAIAGLLSGLGSGLGGILVSVIGKMTGTTARQMQQLMQMLRNMDLVEPGMLPPPQYMSAGWGSLLLSSGLCCLGNLAVGAALGAVGGAIFTAIKKR